MLLYVGSGMLERCPVPVTYIPSLRELFVFLNDKDILEIKVMIGIEQLEQMKSLGIVATGQVITTLVDSHRLLAGMRMQTHPTQISMTAAIDTPVKDLRDLISSNIQCFYPIGDSFSELERDLATNSWILGKRHVPEKIMDRIYASRNLTNLSFQLSPRQAQILYLIVTQGACNKTLAKITKLSSSTIQYHLGAIYKKYEVSGRTELVVAAKNDV